MIAQQVLNEWYPVAMAAQIRAGQRRVTQLLGQPITVDLQKGAIVVTGQGGALHVAEGAVQGHDREAQGLLHVLARQLGRPEEAVSLHTLGELPLDQVDMLTLVLIGNSTSRVQGGRMVTPRGYPGAELT